MANPGTAVRALRRIHMTRAPQSPRPPCLPKSEGDIPDRDVGPRVHAGRMPGACRAPMPPRCLISGRGPLLGLLGAVRIPSQQHAAITDLNNMH